MNPVAATDSDRFRRTRRPISRVAVGECRVTLRKRVMSINRNASRGTTATPTPAATIASTVKIKQAGFHRVFDTEECVRHWLQVLIDRRILPGRRPG